ncbi:hypothetical protein [Arthrobacter crystallopoietes]
MTDAPRQRFLKLSDVQEIRQVSPAQAYALVRSGTCPRSGLAAGTSGG